MSPDGKTCFAGTNACNNPQKVCPREPGEGYEKCKSICDQPGHAEEVALAAARAAGVDVTGWKAVLIDHTYYCRNCQEKLFEAGIATLELYK